MDGHGHVLARRDQETDPLVDHLLIYNDGHWRDVAQFTAEGGLGAGIEGVSLDGTALVQLMSSDEIGTRVWLRGNFPTANSRSCFSIRNTTSSSTLSDPWTQRIIGVSVITDMTQDRYFDPEMEALQKVLEAAFPGYAVHAEAWDLLRQKMVVAVDGPRQPRAYFLLDRTTGTSKRIVTTYKELTAADLGEVKPYPYKARDGLDIPAYLTLPPGKQPNNLPAVILPHGGPMDRDKLQFDRIAQFLANRGYAVLQPNFRESSGYGVKFLEAAYGQWGLKMQDDVTDGVKKLIADGIADPKRICIVGGSYGGYAALAGAAFTPDLYACAAELYPAHSDLGEFLQNSRPGVLAAIPQ